MVCGGKEGTNSSSGSNDPTIELGRNLSFTSGAVALVLGVAALAWRRAGLVPLIVTSLIVAFTLFLRYLKFYRLFSVELFISFLTSVKEDND